MFSWWLQVLPWLHWWWQFNSLLSMSSLTIVVLWPVMSPWVGEAHPSCGEGCRDYVQMIRSHITSRHVESHVVWLYKYFGDDELPRLYQAADIFITAYSDSTVSNSGTGSMAMAAGRAVIPLTPHLTTFSFLDLMFTHHNMGVEIIYIVNRHPIHLHVTIMWWMCKCYSLQWSCVIIHYRYSIVIPWWQWSAIGTITSSSINRMELDEGSNMVMNTYFTNLKWMMKWWCGD